VDDEAVDDGVQPLGLDGWVEIRRRGAGVDEGLDELAHEPVQQVVDLLA